MHGRSSLMESFVWLIPFLYAQRKRRDKREERGEKREERKRDRESEREKSRLTAG